MRYFSLILLFLFLSIPTFAKDDPEIKQVARLGQGTAYTVAVHPSGKVLAVGTSIGVRFYDDKWKELARFVDIQPIDQLAWSSDGKQLLVGYRETTASPCHIAKWNISNDFTDQSLVHEADYCTTMMTWSKDGALLAVGIESHTRDESIYILDSDSLDFIEEVEYVLKDYFQPIQNENIRHEHHNICYRNICRNFSIVPREVYWLGDTLSIFATSIFQSGESIGTSTWTTNTEEFPKYKGGSRSSPYEESTFSQISNSSEFMVIQNGWGDNFSIAQYNPTVGYHSIPTVYYTNNETAPSYLFYSNDAKRVAYINFDFNRTINLLESIEDKDNRVELQTTFEHAPEVIWSHDNTLIATIENYQERLRIGIWDTVSGAELDRYNLVVDTVDSQYHLQTNLTWRPDNSGFTLFSFVATMDDGCFIVDLSHFDINNGESMNLYRQDSLPSPTHGESSCRRKTFAEWSPDSRYLAVPFKNIVTIYSTPLNNPEVIEMDIESTRTVDFGDLGIMSLNWHESGNYLAGGASDGTIYVWDVSALLEE